MIDYIILAFALFGAFNWVLLAVMLVAYTYYDRKSRRLRPYHWVTYDDCPLEDWKEEVEQDATRQGYHDWAEVQREYRREDAA